MDVTVSYMPVNDWDTRLRKVMELLLRNSNNTYEKSGVSDSERTGNP